VGNDSRYVLCSGGALHTTREDTPGLRGILVFCHEYRYYVQGTINLDGLEELLRAVIRDELSIGSGNLHGGCSGFLDAKGAATYLATSEQALRAACKRGQVPVHKTPQGRLLFDPAELEAYVRGESA
jgi:hypothetical protein